MGKALIMPGDLFGDCVNVASKLGEDTCKAGEIMVDRKTFASIPAEDVWALQDAGFTTTVPPPPPLPPPPTFCRWSGEYGLRPVT